MLKEKANFINILWRINDLLIIIISLLLSYALRFTFFPYKSILPPSISQLWSNFLLLIILWFIFAEIHGLYRPKRIVGPGADWNIIFRTQIITLLIYSAIGFIFKSFDLSRLLLIFYFVVSCSIVGLWHHLIRSFLAQIRRKGFNKRTILIIGTGTLGLRLAGHLHAHPEYGFSILGFLDDQNKVLNNYSIPLLGKIDDLLNIYQKYHFDRVMITLPLSKVQQITQITEQCEYEGIEVNIVPDIFKFVRPRTQVYDINGIPVIGIRRTPVDTWQYLYLKRGFDIIFSSLIMIFTCPVFLTIAILLKLTSKGPVFFKQKRLGANGKEFDFYKFRTMKITDKKTSDTTWTTSCDERITTIGRFLRHTSLDELPQFYNVLKGDMSVVGPRPERPHFARLFQKDVPKYMVRHQVRTGITGWAQVNGFRGDTSISKRVEYDLYYIENWSFSFDLKIIWLTLWKAMLHKNAY